MSKQRLIVDPISCDAHGICAELLPELIATDEWGYPLLSEQHVPAELLALARQAVRSCPRRALLLAAQREKRA
ncbi:MAG TPA: ferredoxin [Solirubrobacteraceae bacterium]|nr:ferredoxin [Solirubrobacteraceae bacterium]